jgi:hypothetical protein
MSSPKFDVVTSNLNQNASEPKQKSLRSLDDQLKAPFNFLDNNDAGAVPGMVPVVRPTMISPRAAKELKERRAEQDQWMFGSPEELEAERQSAARMFGLSEYDEGGVEKSPQTPFQRYWQRMEKERLGQTNSLSSDLGNSETTDHDIKEQARAMFGTLNLPTEKGPDLATSSTVSPGLNPGFASPLMQEVSPLRCSADLFVTPSTTFAAPKNEATVSRMNEFKQLFDRAPAPSLGSSSLGALNSASVRSPAADFSSPLAGGLRTTLSPSVGSYESLSGGGLGKSAFAPPTAPTLATPPPIFQTPRVTTPPAGFQIPRRSF